jgi:hypothetical protein
MKMQLATQMNGADVAVALRGQAALDLLRRIPPIAPRSIANPNGGADNAQDRPGGGPQCSNSCVPLMDER